MFGFFTPENENRKKNNIMMYDFYDTTIHLNQCEKNATTHGFIKMPFVSGKTPNLWIDECRLRRPPSHLNEKTHYKTTNLYIMKRGGFNGKDHDGELIIELVPVTNGVDKVYVMFLLKTEKAGGLGEKKITGAKRRLFSCHGVATEGCDSMTWFGDAHEQLNSQKNAVVIDQIIRNAGKTEHDEYGIHLYQNMERVGESNHQRSVLNMNDIIPTSRIVQQHNVYVFTSPIVVKSSFESFRHETLFVTVRPKYFEEITAIHSNAKEHNAECSGENDCRLRRTRQNITEGLDDNTDKYLTELAKKMGEGNAVLKCSPIDETGANDNVQYVPITKEKTTFGHDMFVVFFIILLLCFAGVLPVVLTFKWLTTIFPKTDFMVFVALTVAFFISLGVYFFSMPSGVGNMFGMVIVIFVIFSCGISFIYSNFQTDVWKTYEGTNSSSITDYLFLFGWLQKAWFNTGSTVTNIFTIVIFFVGIFFVLFSLLFEMFNTGGKMRNPFDNKHNQNMASALFAPVFYVWLVWLIAHVRHPLMKFNMNTNAKVSP